MSRRALGAGACSRARARRRAAGGAEQTVVLARRRAVQHESRCCTRVPVALRVHWQDRSSPHASADRVALAPWAQLQPIIHCRNHARQLRRLYTVKPLAFQRAGHRRPPTPTPDALAGAPCLQCRSRPEPGVPTLTWAVVVRPRLSVRACIAAIVASALSRSIKYV